MCTSTISEKHTTYYIIARLITQLEHEANIHKVGATLPFSSMLPFSIHRLSHSTSQHVTARQSTSQLLPGRQNTFSITSCQFPLTMPSHHLPKAPLGALWSAKLALRAAAPASVLPRLCWYRLAKLVGGAGALSLALDARREPPNALIRSLVLLTLPVDMFF